MAATARMSISSSVGLVGVSRKKARVSGRTARLEHRDRRIRKARIRITGLFVLEASFGLLGGLVDEARRHIERLRGLAEGRAERAFMDHAGRERQISERAVHEHLQKRKPGRAEAASRGFRSRP